MSDVQNIAANQSSLVAEDTQSSLIVGKLREDDGIWGALAAVTAVETVRNGVLVVFSPEGSGRLGVFCNQFISGGIVNRTGESGIEGLQKLLEINSGMFCFRPCLADEANELGQSLSLSIPELLEQRRELSLTDIKTPRNAPAQLKNIQSALPDRYLAEVADAPVESALVVSLPPSAGDAANGSVQADSLPVRACWNNEQTPVDYLDWFENQSQGDDKLNLRRILLPIAPQACLPERPAQVNAHLKLFKQVLEEEKEKLQKDIERSLSTAKDGADKGKLIDDMKLLAGMLQSQETLINERWQGLDDIAAPKVPVSSGSGAGSQTKVQSAAPSNPAIVAGCQDLINTQTIRMDPRRFLKTPGDKQDRRKDSWLNKQHLQAACSAIIVAALIALAYCQFHNLDVDRCLHQGQDHLHARQWRDAILSFDDAISKDPGRAGAYYDRALAYIEIGEEDRAAADLHSAAMHGLQEPQVQLAQASIAVRHQNWAKALDWCNQLILGGHASVELFRLSANCRTHLLDFPNAAKDLTSALELCKNDQLSTAKIKAERGYVELQMNQMDQGAADFADALKTGANPAISMLRGDAYRKSHRYEQACQDYSDAIMLEPRNYNAYVARGICQAAMHRDRQAVDDFTRAIALNAKGVEALIQRGSLHLANGLYRPAISDLEEAWRLNPGVEETKQKLQLAYSHLAQPLPGEIASANKLSKPPALKLPKDPDELVKLGYQCLSQGNIEQALACLTQAVRVAPNHAIARRYLAHTLSSGGWVAEASTQFDALIRLQALTADDALTYAKDLELDHQPLKAEQMLLTVLGRDPSQIEVRLSLANIYFRAGLKGQGVQMCTDGLKRAKSDDDRRLLQELLMHPPSADSQVEHPTGSADNN